MKQLQNTLDREDRSKITSTRDNLKKCFEFSVDPFHEIRDSYVGRKWRGPNTKIHQRFVILLKQKLKLVVNFRNIFPEVPL
jgi:hypothetical protein